MITLALSKVFFVGCFALDADILYIGSRSFLIPKRFPVLFDVLKIFEILCFEQVLHVEGIPAGAY